VSSKEAAGTGVEYVIVNMNSLDTYHAFGSACNGRRERISNLLSYTTLVLAKAHTETTSGFNAEKIGRKQIAP
jgi:hypothetical protein